MEFIKESMLLGLSIMIMLAGIALTLLVAFFPYMIFGVNSFWSLVFLLITVPISFGIIPALLLLFRKIL